MSRAGSWRRRFAPPSQPIRAPASALLNQAQRRGIAQGIDYRLAERRCGRGPNSRRSVKIEWMALRGSTTWRFGSGDRDQCRNSGRALRHGRAAGPAWEARARQPCPLRSVAGHGGSRNPARRVFRRGVRSASIRRLPSVSDADDSATQRGDLLRDAYAGDSIRARIDAMRQFWQIPARRRVGSPVPDGVYYGALPVIARAAAALPPTDGRGEDTPWLMAAMLSGGYDRSAARWSAALDRL